MKELVIASNNKGKILEIRSILKEIQLLSLADIGFNQPIDEPFETFEKNALTKASAINKFAGRNVMADDSGICVNALGGAPGVHSAYYGGEPRSDEKNNSYLLQMLKPHEDRSAYYKAVICLIWDEQTYFFEGICEGTLLTEPRGDGGFGYDPLFVPNGYEQTFAELPLEIKNSISHRGKAVRKLAEFLNDRNTEDEIFPG